MDKLELKALGKAKSRSGYSGTDGEWISRGADGDADRVSL